MTLYFVGDISPKKVENDIIQFWKDKKSSPFEPEMISLGRYFYQNYI